MKPSLDPETFYRENYDDMHRFLWYKGVTNVMDREDIINEFALRTITTPRILRDLVANDNERGSLTVRNFHCQSIQYYRDHEKKYRNQDTFYYNVSCCFDTTSSYSDTTSVVDVNLAINDFMVWDEKNRPTTGPKVPDDSLQEACEKIKAGENMHGQYWHKRFQKRRDLYKKRLA